MKDEASRNTEEDLNRRLEQKNLEIQKQYHWDKYFIDIADVVRSNSKDPNTKIGVVIVGPDREIRSTGYNGFPIGVTDTPERWERPLKYEYVAHAERNAIDLAARHGASMKDCTLYMVAMDLACNECAKTIIQAGIKEVVVFKYKENSDTKWNDAAKVSKEMFAEAGVEWRFFNY